MGSEAEKFEEQENRNPEPSGQFNPGAIIEQVKALTFSPKEAWNEIASRNTTLQSDYMRYFVPLAALAAVCGFIGMTFVGISIFGFTVKAKFFPALLHATANFGMMLAMPFIAGAISAFFAEKFNGSSNPESNRKLFLYAALLPSLASVINLVPILSILLLVTGIYSLYILYQGITPMIGVPAEKRIIFSIATIISLVVTMMIFSAIVAIFLPELYSSNPSELLQGMDINIPDAMKEFTNQ